ARPSGGMESAFSRRTLPDPGALPDRRLKHHTPVPSPRSGPTVPITPPSVRISAYDAATPTLRRRSAALLRWAGAARGRIPLPRERPARKERAARADDGSGGTL